MHSGWKGPVVDGAGRVQQAATSEENGLGSQSKALISYLLDSEVHTFAFSVAANAILSFIPFLVLLYALSYSVFRSSTMSAAVTDVVYFIAPSNQVFVANNLIKTALRHGVQVLSLIMILVACTGIFLPLEVALNKAWGITKSRNYLSNQIVAFGLAILMVLLGLGAVFADAVAKAWLVDVLPDGVNSYWYLGTYHAVLGVTTGLAGILFIFSVFWLLPNKRIAPGSVAGTAVITGIVWVLAKYPFEALLPYLDLQGLYGPFYVSVGLIFWSYTSGLILFAGAQVSVAKARR